MRTLLLNPWTWLVTLAVLLGAIGGGYWWGHSAATTACAAKAGAAAAKVGKIEAKRDERIDAVAAATASAVAAAINQNRSSADESAARILTVEVPAPCRAVDPVSLRELRAARADANAALGVGVRPDAAGADPARP